jgi:hypothetical protein
LSKSLVLGGNAFDSGLVTPGSIPGTGGFDTFCRNYVYIYLFFFDNSKNVCIDFIGNVIREIKTKKVMMFVSPAINEAT